MKNKQKSNKKQPASPAVSKSVPSSSIKKSQAPIYITLLLFFITIVVFKGTLGNQFVNWDDEVNFLENPNILMLDWEHIKRIFSDRVIGNYNPLPILTFAIEYHFVEFKPFIYHFNNLVLHLICVYFVYRIFIALRFSYWSAFAGALIFAIHPMKVESVAWVTERKDVLFGAFFLPALLLYIKNKTAEKPSIKTNILIFILFILALLSKIQAVALPLTMIAVDYYLDKKWSIRSVLQKVPYLLFSLLFGLMGIYFLAEEKSLQNATTNFNIFGRLLVGCKAYMLYIIKFIVPFKMSPLYPYPDKLNAEYYIAPLGIIAVLVLVYIAWKKNWTALIAGLAIFTFNIIFLLQILGAGQGLFADRFSYIAYLGLILPVVYLLDYYQKQRQTINIPAYWISGIFLLIFSIVSVNQVKVWENGATLWSHVIKYYDNITTPWQNRARYYRDHNQIELAISDLNTALALNSDKGTTYNSLAKIYFDRQEFGKALQNYDSSIVYKKDNNEAYINRGACYCMLNQIDKGIIDIEKGISLKPEKTVLKNAYKNLGLAYLTIKDYNKSLGTMDELLQLEPLEANAWYVKSMCYINTNRVDEAINAINKAIEMDPENKTYLSEKAKYQQNKSGNLNPANTSPIQSGAR